GGRGGGGWAGARLSHPPEGHSGTAAAAGPRLRAAHRRDPGRSGVQHRRGRRDAPLGGGGVSVLSEEMGDDEVLVVTIDVPGGKVNTLGRACLEEFDALVSSLERRSEVGGVVVRSGKPDNFIAGADINEFTTIRSALEGETMSRTAQGLLDRLEAARVPVVAAIHGSCVGGGLETVLACRYRIATN